MQHDSKKQTAETIILGVGNLLMGDDGVGVHAARALMQHQLPAGIAVLDVGMAFLESLPVMESSEHIIVIDAMNASGEPGTIYRCPLFQCSSPERIDSLHNFDVFRMLALAQNKKSNDVVVFGVEPERIGWGLELSPTVAASLPYLLDAVRQEIGIVASPVDTGIYQQGTKSREV